jgi:tetratricopeptide (TPR) repeat protein
VLAIAGDYSGARDYNLKALDLRMEWMNRLPGDREAQRGVASSYQELGNHYESLGDWNEVLKCRLKALEILDKLNSEGKVDRSLRLAWALANKRYGKALGRRNEPELAMSFLQRALLIEKGEAEKYQHYGPLLMNLSFTHFLIANQYLERGEYPLALKAMTESYEIRRDLARVDPKDVRAASLLSTSTLGLGRIYTRMGKFREAMENIRESLSIREELAQRDPKNAGARGEIAEASAALADLLFERRRYAEAREAYARANEIYSDLLANKKLVAELKEEAARVSRRLQETQARLDAQG